MPVETVTVALTLVCRTLLGLVFARSAWGKLADLAGFARGLGAYQLLPAWAITPLAWVLPLLELALAVAFLLGLMVPVAGGIAALLLVPFIAAIVINLRRGRTIACNCHGSGHQTPISWGLVARNGLLVGLALLLVFVAPFARSPTALVAQWRAELVLLFSSSALPLAMLVCWFIACSLLLSTVIDVRRVVRQVAQRERSAQ